MLNLKKIPFFADESNGLGFVLILSIVVVSVFVLFSFS